MEIAVFGATGGTGNQFVAQATGAGHHPRALTRSPEKLSGWDAVASVKGNVLEPDTVLRTIEGTDAAVCILGRTKSNPVDVVSRGTEHIVGAMQEHDVRRLVVVTSIGLGASVTNLPWYGRLANATVLHDLMADKARQEELVMQSGLDWTIVRPGGLTDGPHTGNYVHGSDVDVEAAPISRADVAEFLVRVLEQDLYMREAPLVTTREGVDLAFLWEQVRDVTTRLLWGT
ncbi:NAD(P)-dependent oxidoreductase [Salinibacter ruber]|jgi:putative NADH-flavin reductase|uniref:NAD(P)-dependent oxidoreductase n=1 Tax=Salinibacter ruber TaxID=146919 RepID=UPI00216A2D6A|nr:SDR family oxidoreductase [Salinibacter ruber]MCS3659997.1 putative NADH-flavin reductase [Salinibacter ruber]